MAVKVLRYHTGESALRELRNLAALRSPYLVKQLFLTSIKEPLQRSLNQSSSFPLLGTTLCGRIGWTFNLPADGVHGGRQLAGFHREAAFEGCASQTGSRAGDRYHDGHPVHARPRHHASRYKAREYSSDSNKETCCENNR